MYIKIAQHFHTYKFCFQLSKYFTIKTVVKSLFIFHFFIEEKHYKAVNQFANKMVSYFHSFKNNNLYLLIS